MKFIKNLKITGKILIGLGLMAALCGGMTTFAVLKAGEMSRGTTELVNDPVAGTRLAAKADSAFTRMHQLAYEIAVESDDGDVATLQKTFDENASDLNAAIVAMRPLIDGEHVAPYGVITSNIPAYLKLEAEVLALRREHRTAETEITLQSRLEPVFERINGAADLLVSQQQQDIDAAAAKSRADYHSVLMWLIGAGVGGTLLVGGFAVFISRREISSPIDAMTRVMQRLAGGDNTIEVLGAERKDELGEMAAAVQSFKDAAIEKIRLEQEAADQRRQTEEERARNEALQAEAARQQALVVNSVATGLEKLSAGELTYRLSEAFAAEYEKLREDFNGAMEQLQETMKVISGSTQGIRSGTDEISQAADDLSKRTEQQAASLEETAAALDQITATVRKTAEGANHARDVVSAAKADAEHSGQVVRDAVAAMTEIENSAQQISQIIGVIDEIAFQTNLLALNAGVEAARAGDAGRGFAVVASEVRALAQRSASAAKEIKTLISASTSQVEQGVELVGETGNALTRIVAQVADINSVVSEIAASAQEQATGLHQVNTAVNQMDQVTQQNAAMVEQSTAASHSLAQEAEELGRLISRFQVGAPAVVSPPHRAAARPAAGPTRTVLKTVSTSVRGGGAVRKAAPVGDVDSWEEF
jgi:methyl-accepting chemotaxis protein